MIVLPKLKAFALHSFILAIHFEYTEDVTLPFSAQPSCLELTSPRSSCMHVEVLE
jgi:hypothetical protein